LRVVIKVYVLVCILLPLYTKAQAPHEVPLTPPTDTISAKKPLAHTENPNSELDLIDVVQKLVNKKAVKRTDTTSEKSGKVRISGVPAAGYTLQTGFAALLVGNAVFCLGDNANTNISNITANITYSQYNQIILPMQSNIWFSNNKYNLTTDWRYLKYPSYTYGLGGYTSFSDQYSIDYYALRFHQTLYRKIAHELYLGLGYDFDYFWDIKEIDPPAGKVSDFEKYGFSKTEEASGVSLNFLYDTRKNSVNAQNGNFINVVYRPNLTFFGNDATWSSLIIDARKYIQFPAGSSNVLAFWNYDWLTVSGAPPYLLLPNTGGDPYTNTGRGYIQGRYRGKNMLYGEGEYRFGVSQNGLLGGVIFLNAQSFTEEASNRFEVISPGYGAGIRIKLNKFSNTNIAIDYGLGTHGSGGFFVNLGEIF
jgi:hypothetical protein